MKKVIAILCCISAIILFSSCNRSVDVLNNHARSIHKDSPGEIQLTFDYTKQKGFSSNQIAAWLENEKGKIVYTFMVTEFTAEKGYKKRPDSLATWVAKANPKEMDKEQVDMIAQATPATGTVTCKWDCVDDKGVAIKPGTYALYVEGTIYEKDSVVYFGAITIGDEPSEAVAVPGFKTEKSKSSNMLLNVKAQFIPKES